MNLKMFAISMILTLAQYFCTSQDYPITWNLDLDFLSIECFTKLAKTFCG